MAVSAEDFLNFSKDLHKENRSEIEIRGSVRTAYYSAFHKSHEILTHEVPDDLKGGTHIRFIEYLELKAHAIEKDITQRSLDRLGIKLRQLKANRVIADYHMQEDVSEEDSLRQIKLVESTFDLCNYIIENKDSES